MPTDETGKNAEPLWVAKLEVYARELYVLSHFNPGQDLSREDMTLAIAGNEPEFSEFYYQWDKSGSEHCFNAIYDQKPLSGWWPWPRKNTECEEIGL
ncbi:uncharacterized protein B0I36DRAFT_316628 [Microdochium trichocladiopsis]|uniref:Uncharacterized protein n=1 Tax=Microdochium trichocladiopsis TaxID=1682393 RepID=A0A9P8YB31_9PEZI|nr:uncharacterized protein B0I36DRAFT_316628 [Microdochium trichocladiopsis]KAH7034610.1 hypothetical protein B0I36DRAFT_316628 [Microdochium trichocladiopsis]